MDLDNLTNQYVRAMWYAYGRTDADPSSPVDPENFGVHFRRLAEDCQRGASSFLPSIRDAFNAYEDRLNNARD